MSTMTNWSWNCEHALLIIILVNQLTGYCAVAVVMWTPPMLAKLGGFGTFLFFAIINFCFW